MKVLVIGKKNHLNFDGHIVDAFKELNHNVEHFQINVRPKYFQIKRGIYKTFLGKSKGNEKSDLELSKMLNERVENFKPDLVFFSSAFFIPKIFYKVIKFQFPKIKVFAWDIDSGYNEKVNHTFKDFIDVLYVHEKGFIEENKIFFKEIRYLPLCTNPYFYKNFF